MPQSTPQQFSGIFVSYRRDDSSGHAGRLSDKLVDHFGKDRIFMDIDTIEPGEDFVTVIEEAVGSCQILIAIIGRNWVSTSDKNTGRLDNPNDFVRLEIASALSRDIRVIPVLVQGAKMPKPQDLPNDLAKLARRNAVELSDLRWKYDVDRLIEDLQNILARREEASRKAAQEEEDRSRREAEALRQRGDKDRSRLRAVETERQREAEEKRASRAIEKLGRPGTEKGRGSRSEKKSVNQDLSRRKAEKEIDKRPPKVEIVVPHLGESIEVITIGKWLKKVGDYVGLDEPLVEVSTDKVDVEVGSTGAGILSEIRFKEGETVEVNAVLAVIEQR